MGHHINAIIGKREALAGLIEHLGSPPPTALACDLVIVPLDEQRLDKIAMSIEQSFDGFAYLTFGMADEIGRIVPKGCVLYIETNHFSGMGSQSAAFFDNGALRWKRSHLTFAKETAEKSPISDGLSNLGVVPQNGQDEFDELGLGRFRSLETLGLDEE